MRINIHLLAKSMIGAAQGAGPGAPEWMRAHPIAEVQLKALAAVTDDIDTKLRLGQISEERAGQMYLMCQNAVHGVLLSEGAEPMFTDKLLQAAARVITGPLGRAVAGAIAGPMGQAVAGGLTAAFKAGKDL